MTNSGVKSIINLCELDQKIFLDLFKNKIILIPDPGRTTNFSSSSSVAVVGSGIRGLGSEIWDPRSWMDKNQDPA